MPLFAGMRDTFPLSRLTRRRLSVHVRTLAAGLGAAGGGGLGAHRAAWTPRLPVRDATTPSLQSELPFRMLTRRHGVQLAYTPMLHAQMFATRPKYREATFSTCEGDRPLFVQFCANDPDTFVAAAKKVQHLCDAIDLNLGCPQGIAKRGNYGSFLMDDLDRVKALVSAARAIPCCLLLKRESHS